MATKRTKNRAAVALAKLRMVKMTAEERQAVSRQGGLARAENLDAASLSEIGRLGGAKGGKARARSLTPEQRAEIAKKAAEARWGKSAR